MPLIAPSCAAAVVVDVAVWHVAVAALPTIFERWLVAVKSDELNQALGWRLPWQFAGMVIAAEMDVVRALGTSGLDCIAGAVGLKKENSVREESLQLLVHSRRWDCHAGWQLVVREIYVCGQHGGLVSLYMCACCHQRG